jgi:quercetin dioxygenase-like cupin family protein
MVALTKMTEGLPDIVSIGNGYREYKAGQGTAFSWVLHRVGNTLLVQRWFMSAGSEWKDHSHPGIEIVYIYEGEIKMIVDGKETICKKGDVLKIEPNIIHSGMFPVDTKVIVITADPIEIRYANGK